MPVLASKKSRDFLLGTDLEFPLVTDGRGGLSIVSGADCLEQALLHWIETAVGDVLYSRDKGIGADRWVHADLRRVAATAPAQIEQNIPLWEPRIKSIKVANVTVDEVERTLEIDVDYTDMTYGISRNATYTLNLARRTTT